MRCCHKVEGFAVVFLLLGAAVNNLRHASLGGGVFALRCCQAKTIHIPTTTIRLPVVHGQTPVHQSIFLGVTRAPRKDVIWWWHLPPLYI